MEAQQSFTTQLGISSLIPFLIISLVIIFNGKERLSGRVLLAIIVLIIALVSAISIYSSFKGIEATYPPQDLFNFTLGALGPLLYFYVNISLIRKYRFKFSHLWNFLPILVPIIFLAIVLLTGNIYFLSKDFFLAHRIIEALWLIAWWILTLRVIQKNGIKLKDFFFNFKNLRITWLRVLYLTLLLLWVGKFYLFFQYAYSESPNSYFEGLSLFFVAVLFFLSFLLFVVMNRRLFLDPEKPLQVSTESSQEFVLLDGIIKSKSLYLNPDLDLLTLSQKSGIHPKTISYLVNSSTGANLNEYLNKLRIEYAQTLLRDKNSKAKILSILLDSGFNSKSAFNNAFKKYTGLTPHEFRQQNS